MPITDNQRKHVDLLHTKIDRVQRKLNRVHVLYDEQRDDLNDTHAQELEALEIEHQDTAEPWSERLAELRDELVEYLDTLDENV